MIKLIVLLLPLFAMAEEPFLAQKPNSFDTSAYDTKKCEENVKASKNTQIRCRYVCDRKLYKEQKISDAIEFYKRTRDYSSTDN